MDLEHQHIKLISERFALPLFMISRNRLKYARLQQLERYLDRHAALYAGILENNETATQRHLRHLIGLESYRHPHKCEHVSRGSVKRDLNTHRSWALPPNRYDISHKPYAGRSGTIGAHWPRIHENKSRKSRALHRRGGADIFYELPGTMERLTTECHKYRGIFLTNAREHRATNRCMISNILTCYHDPKEPGPTTYNPVYEKIQNYKKPTRPNPFHFYRHSSVPVKKNSCHPAHTSFNPAPGRYEVRCANCCHCPGNLMYQPQLQLIIDQEKRKKFRRLPFGKIKASLYCEPDWRHVRGRGFRRLFKATKRTTSQLDTVKETHSTKEVKLYAAAKYIGMINKPTRTPLGIRCEPMLEIPPTVKYNSLAKRSLHKQLRTNKRIVFGSAQERFRDGNYRPTVLTQTQLEAVKQSLPEERRFYDRPVMTKREHDIKSKLLCTPQHMLPNYVPKLRKRLFKFLPIPLAKILVTETDVKAHTNTKDGYYHKVVDSKVFFKDNI